MVFTEIRFGFRSLVIVLTSAFAWSGHSPRVFAEEAKGAKEPTVEIDNLKATVFRHLDAGEVDDALLAQRKLVAISIENFGRDDFRSADFSLLLSDIEKMAELEKLDRAAILSARLLANEVKLCLSREDYSRAAELCNEALNISVKYYGESSLSTVGLLEYLGWIQLCMQKPIDAQKSLGRLVAARKQISTERHPLYSYALVQLGRAYLDAENFEDAEKAFREAAELTRQHFGNHKPSYADALTGLALALAAKGSLLEAEVFAQIASSIYEKSYGEKAVAIGPCLEAGASVCIAREQNDAARQLLLRAKDIYSNGLAVDSLIYATALERTARLMKKIEDGDEVKKLEARVADIRSKKQQR